MNCGNVSSGSAGGFLLNCVNVISGTVGGF